jgi:hypothetical protein
MVNDAVNAKNSPTLPPLPALSESERDAIVARARIELFKLLPNISESDWPFLEIGLQVRINTDRDLNLLFWTEPERAVVFALGDFAKWAETDPTWRGLEGKVIEQ